MGKKTVLIVDDDPDVVRAIRFGLEREEIQCLEANDGEAALRTAQREKPDLIVLDVMLPGINGYKVARLLKFDQSYRNTPIIMLTARSADSDRELGEETGADVYVTKPFKIDTLVAVVKKSLSPS